MLILGIALGLATGLLASGSYLASRSYTAAAHRTPLQLWAVSHIIQGVLCTATMPIAWWVWRDSPVWDDFTWLWWVIGVTGFYLMGQTCLFIALRRVEASKISPLLGVKVAVLAAAAVLILQQSLSAMQWGGVALAVAAAWVINRSGGKGGRVPWAVLGLVGVMLVGYVGSDLSIQKMLEVQGAIGQIPDASSLRSSASASTGSMEGAVVGAMASYVLSGAIAMFTLPWLGTRHRADWVKATPYALMWLGSMLTLFTCISLVGVVLANILQSSRGLWSIVLGVGVAWAGHHHLEAHAPWSVVLRRALGAAMMIAAVTLYVIG